MKPISHHTIYVLILLLIGGGQFSLPSQISAQAYETSSEREVEVAEERALNNLLPSQVKRRTASASLFQNTVSVPIVSDTTSTPVSMTMRIPRMIAFCCFLL